MPAIQNSQQLPDLQLDQKTILIVDDNPTNLAVVADYLESHQFTVLVARNGRSGIQKAQYAQPDIILLDVMMPDIDGFETCRLLKADEQTEAIPVIFMTALAETEHKVRGFQAGAVDYVTKPLQQEEVLARVKTHLHLRALTEHLEQVVAARTRELHEAYEYLERLDQAKEDFIQVVSHEFRTPLSLIDGYSQLLEEEVAQKTFDRSQMSYLIEKIMGGSRRMLELISHVMDATKIDNDSLKLFKYESSLFILVRDVVDRLQSHLSTREVDVILDPSLRELPLIYLDEELISKALHHLIVNAVKYTPDGGRVTISGRISSLDGREGVQIDIVDTGIGVEKKELELIFEKFYQVGAAHLHSTGKIKFKGGGPGLGLAIVRGIVEAHHGRVWGKSPLSQESEEYPGSRFSVWLPTVDVEEGIKLESSLLFADTG